MENTQLDKFLEDLTHGLNNLDDAMVFQKIITESLLVFNLTELHLSEELKTTGPTVNRWKSGITIPHILIREGVYKALLKRARALAKKVKNMEIIQPPYIAPPGFDEEMVWYSPELDELRVAKKSDGFVFMNEHGQFHCMYHLDGTGQVKTYDFYLIGSLEPKPADGRKYCHACKNDVKVIEKMGGTICSECRVILGG